MNIVATEAITCPRRKSNAIYRYGITKHGRSKPFYFRILTYVFLIAALANCLASEAIMRMTAATNMRENGKIRKNI